MSSLKSICKCPMARFAIILAFITLNVLTSTNSFAATQLSQFGITWNFDNNYQTGQFANGDYWVIGPISITGISPSSTNSGGRVMNGSMMNPSPRSGMTQGYDSAMYGNYGPSYSDSLNVALNVSSSNRLTIQPENSLVSSISFSEAGHRPQIRTCAVLTVLGSAPPEGSFRPPYSNVPKTIKFNKNQLDYSQMGTLSPVSGTPSLATAERSFERPWIDHVGGWIGKYAHPIENMPDYGRDLSLAAGDGALMLNLNFSDAQKETLLIRYTQVGIDLYGVAMDGGQGNWINNGGHASGRKWPILFAGIVLGDADMMNIGYQDHIHFGEDGQTFYVSQTDVNSGRYYSSDLGLPEWGIRHSTEPHMDKRDWFEENYRRCCTATAWAGAVLSARIMDAQALWNHDALFDYQDRYMNTEVQYRQMSGFAANMWDAYRANYGGIWPDTTPPVTDNTPPLPPTNLSTTNITSNSISLLWTASQQASDGDYASGYRVYRNGNSVGNTNTTSFTDSSLTSETSYNYSILSYDNANNSSNNALEGTFTTLAGDSGPVDPPIIPPTGDAYYISPNGNNSNSGADWNQALRNLPSTLQRDAVYYFAGGTYPDYTFDDAASGNAYITLQKATIEDHGVETGWNNTYANEQAVFGEIDFSNASHIIFDGISSDMTVLRWNNSSPTGGSVLGLTGSDNITIANCEIDGYFQGSSSNQTNGSCNNVGMDSCSYITITGCQIHDGADDGMQLTNSSNLTISNNEIYDLHGCGTDGGCGPCHNGHSDAIEIFNVRDSQFVGNFTHNIPSDASFFFGNWSSSSSYYCRNILLANNIFYNNVPTGFTIYIEQADNVTLYNNVFWGQTAGSYGGLSLGHSVTNLEMYNNIILSINYAHVDGVYNSSQHRGDYNFFGHSTGQYPERANDIVAADPGFVGINGASGPLIGSVSREDFMLKESSLCINSGTTVDLDLDIAGKTRPIGSAFDRGAFEYGVTGPDTTPPDVTSLIIGENYIEINFNEALEESTATNLENYSITNDITISGANLNTQGDSVILDTSPHEASTDYTLTITNIQDVAGNTMTQTTLDYTFTNDIVGRWLFNETGGNTAQDQSPFQNIANLLGGASFNQTGEVVLTASSAAVEVSMQNMSTSTGTVFVKAQQTVTEGPQYFFGHTVGSWTNNIQIYSENGTLNLGLGSSHATATGITTIESGQYYDIALTWSSGTYSLYVDGIEMATGSYSGLNSLNATADFGNNGNPNYRTEVLNGTIGEAAIYNYTLTAQEIAELSGAPVEDGDALVGYWFFDETTGTSATDHSEYNNDAYLLNGAAFTGDGYVQLSGTDDAVDISMADMTAQQGTVVISATVNSFSDLNYFFGHTVDNWTNNIQLYCDNAALAVGLGDSHTTATNIEVLQPGQYYQIALTWDSSQYAVYINGTQRTSGTYSGLSNLSATADIGNNGNPDFRLEALDGLIDEAMIYNYALSSDEIMELYAPTEEDISLIGYWKFNELEGNQAFDSSTFDNNGTLINGPVFVGDGTIQLDGNDDAIEISTKDMDTYAGTVAIRATAESVAATHYLFGHTTENWQNSIQLYIQNGGLYVGLSGNHTVAANITTIEPDTEYHYTLKWEGTTFAVYINGQELLTDTHAGLTSLNSLADIGNNGNPDLRIEAFAGYISQVRLFNRALSTQEIESLATGKSYGPAVLNLIINHWLDYHPDADIAPPGGDGIVNLLDFRELAANWDPTQD